MLNSAPSVKGNILGQKDFLTISDFTSDQIASILESAKKIKAKKTLGESYLPLKDKTLGMIFEKSSTRTRVSFEVGMLQLGGNALFLSSNDLQIGRGETIADTARVLSEYLDGIMIRTFSHERVEELAKYASIPVINGLTDLAHPCQALADLMTISEIKGPLKGLKMAYIGDGNNMAHSLMAACAKMGMHFSIACPNDYEPNQVCIQSAKLQGEKNGAEIIVTGDAAEAVKDADIIYSDVWTSMGQEKENEIRLEKFKDFQINGDLIQSAKHNFLFMHCLPAHRGEEVTSEVIDGPNSVIFHQAGNRLHAQKALLVDLMQ
ncbi:ornithine carbamoyltransferase [Peribacillus deserti]|uniref:Ornithine carbamoyltransferase n=1 Tax=Peribacillus deserti TaxID=673318 RepID=A0ABS2QNX7_9BACI|nr:ornithine carbamoyltransferase [Peribacillus deserti]MBM7693971.1 ornithine carbamoyltransferase [Peribacillus deserti]